MLGPKAVEPKEKKRKNTKWPKWKRVQANPLRKARRGIEEPMQTARVDSGANAN